MASGKIPSAQEQVKTMNNVEQFKQIDDVQIQKLLEKRLDPKEFNTMKMEPDFKDSYFCWKVKEDFEGKTPEKLIYVKWIDDTGTYYVTWEHWKLLEATRIQELYEVQKEDGED